MKLNDYVKERKITSFKFSSVEIKLSVTTPGEKIAVLHLTEPITQVTGSQFIGDGADRVRMEAYDVETVSIYQRDMADEGIDIKEDGSGIVNSDLQLDIANSGEVWLTSESFRSFGAKRAQETRDSGKAGVYNRMQERRARKLLPKEGTTSLNPSEGAGKGNKGEPTPVVIDEGKEKTTAAKVESTGKQQKVS